MLHLRKNLNRYKSQKQLPERKNTGKNYLVFFILASFMLSLTLFFSGCGEKEENKEEATEQAPVRKKKKNTRKRRPGRKSSRRSKRRSKRGKKKGNVPEKIVIKKRKIPDDKILPINFKVEDIGKDDEFELKYPGASKRRNIFRDIKQSTLLKNEADFAIKKANDMIEQVEALPEGARNDVILKKAKDNLKKAESALKSANYLKAKENAELASKLAYEATLSGQEEEGPKNKSGEMKYKGAYLDNGEWTAFIVMRDSITRKDRLYMKKVGEVIIDDRVDPTIKKNYTFRVEDIFEDYVVLRDMLKNKRFNLIIGSEYKKKLNDVASKKKKNIKTAEPTASKTSKSKPKARKKSKKKSSTKLK